MLDNASPYSSDRAHIEKRAKSRSVPSLINHLIPLADMCRTLTKEMLAETPEDTRPDPEEFIGRPANEPLFYDVIIHSTTIIEKSERILLDGPPEVTIPAIADLNRWALDVIFYTFEWPIKGDVFGANYDSVNDRRFRKWKAKGERLKYLTEVILTYQKGIHGHIESGSNATTPNQGDSSKAEHKLNPIAYACSLKMSHPELSQNLIAEEVGISPSTLSRNPIYQKCVAVTEHQGNSVKRPYKSPKRRDKQGQTGFEAIDDPDEQ